MQPKKKKKQTIKWATKPPIKKERKTKRERERRKIEIVSQKKAFAHA